MIYISGTKDFKLTNTAVALGKFDGLHRGHQVLVNQINHYKEKGMMSVVFTFDYHPNSLFGDNETKFDLYVCRAQDDCRASRRGCPY